MLLLQLGHACEGMQWSTWEMHRPPDARHAGSSPDAPCESQHGSHSNDVLSQQHPTWERQGFLCVPFSPSADVTTGARHLPSSWGYPEVKPALSGCQRPGSLQNSALRLKAYTSPGENMAFLSVMLTLPASRGGEMGQCWGASSRGHITPAHCSPE